MTFLAPMAGIIAAGLTIPVLLLFYFLKLRRRQVRISSTLLWATAIQDLQVNTPFRWLRFSFLLLLQLLALLALLGAVARPAIRDDSPRGSRFVIVIDRSASMSALDGAPPGQPPSTRLDDAKRQAEETITSLARRSGGIGFSASDSDSWQACVVTFAGRPQALTAFTSSAGVLRDAVRSVTPSDQPADLPALLRFIDALAGGSADESVRADQTTVLVFSDGSFGPATDLPRPRAIDARLVRAGPAPAPSHDNLGIVSLSAKRDYDDPAIVRVFVRVRNASSSPLQTTLQLRLDDQLVDAKPLTIPGQPADASDPTIVGESSATFELQNADGGVALVTITRPDLLAADDSAALVIAPPGRARVLLVAPAGTGGQPQPDPFLSGVLDAMDLRGRRTVGEAALNEMTRRAGDTSLIAGGDTSVPDARDWDLVILDRVRPAELPRQATISFGASLPIPGLSISTPQPARPATRFVSWLRTHPVLRYVGLDQVLIAPPVLLALPTEAGGTVPSVLAWGEDGPLIGLIESPGAPQRIVVAFDIARSNWGPEFSFPVFLANAVDYLTLRGDASSGASYSTTDAIQFPADPAAAEVALDGPLSIRVPRNPASPDVATIGQIERAGLYRVTGAMPGSPWLAVNLCNETETLLKTEDRLPIAGQDAAARTAQEQAPREIWHWFVAFAFVMLTIEWFVQAWRMRGR